MRKWYPLIVFMATVVISVVAYPRLPARVPTHWDLEGHINGDSSRWAAALMMPVMIVAMWGWFGFLPTIDPRRANYEKFTKAYDRIRDAVITMLAAVHALIIGSALGYPVNAERVAPVAVGLLLVVIGNVLPQARPTWFVGVRTPWTLSNDRVWERTHRVAGHLTVAAGVLTVALAFGPPRIAGPGIGVLGITAAVGSVIYSYVAWKQETSR